MKSIFTFLLFFQFLFAYDSIEIPSKNITLHSASYFADESHMSAQEAFELYKKNKFSPLPKKALSLGFQSSTQWFAFDVSFLNVPENLYFYIRHNVTEHATLYTFKDSKLISEEKNGYLIPLQERMQQQLPLRFELKSDLQELTYLLKINSINPHLSAFVIANDDVLDTIYMHDFFIFIFLSGLVIGMVLYNFMLYFFTFERLYFYYGIYVLSLYFLVFFTHGYLPLLSNSLVLATPLLIMLIIQIGVSALVLFANLFLDLKKSQPKLYKRNIILLILVIISISSIPFASELKIIGPLSVFLLLGALLHAGFVCLEERFHSARYFLLATGISLVFFMLYIMMLNGKLEYTMLSFNLLIIGLSWDVIVLSLALAYRIKSLEDENIKTERMLLLKSRQNAIGELTGNVAHQWRQPLGELGAIFSKIEAKLRYATISKEELLASIDKSTKIFKNLSNTIDTFAGFFQNIDTKEKFSVNEEITNNIEFLKDSLTNNSITIHYNSNISAIINGNKNEFSQVLLNIVLNAKDTIIERKIKDGNISIHAEQNKEFLVIHIQDNGGGINIKPIEKIFDSYVTDKKKGTGIGLFLAKSIVENKFNAKIEALNTELGARFTLTFSAM